MSSDVTFADRTGDPDIDRCIDAFVARDVYLDDVGLECDAAEIIAHDPEFAHPLHVIRDAERAAGRCGVLASRFAEFARVHHRLDAVSSEDVYGSMPTPPAVWGYPTGDRAGHVVTLIEHRGRSWVIDFTAAQYQVSAFPAVQPAQQLPAS